MVRDRIRGQLMRKRGSVGETEHMVIDRIPGSRGRKEREGPA
jgi:hypothetical protein